MLEAPAVRAAVEDAAAFKVLLVTGMSGAGRSSALNFLEDLGYEAMDNIPLNLLMTLLTAGATPPRTRHGAIAAGIDIRTRDFDVEHFMENLSPLLRDPQMAVSLVFLDCDDDVIARRYTETRRRHPLAEDRRLLDGIRMEREIVGALRERADLVIDTTSMTTADLRRIIAGHFALAEGPGLTATVTSFSFRNGLPREADLVFDVRFLRNPHYVEALRPKTGLDPEVGAYIEADEALAPFLSRTSDLLIDLLPRYAAEGKTYLTIAVGCTGGRHRSVYVAERLARTLEAAGHVVHRRHRDTDVAGGER